MQAFLNFSITAPTSTSLESAFQLVVCRVTASALNVSVSLV